MSLVSDVDDLFIPDFVPRTGAVILAAGKGTRMHSDTPKVLLRMLEEPMLRYVYDGLDALPLNRCWTVVGHGADQVREAFPDRVPDFVEQNEQLGTGHALRIAWPLVTAASLDYVLVINGDTPLAPAEALGDFLSQSIREQADIAFISLALPDPGALGRVLRRSGQVAAVVEAKDFDEVEHGPEPNEINAGIYCLKVSAVTELLPLLSDNNKSGEFYITDLIGLAADRGLSVFGHNRGEDPNLLGINTPAELVRSEELIRVRIVEAHLNAGVIIRYPRSVRIGPDVRLEPGVDITGPCEMYGRIDIASGARIASHCRLADSVVAEGAEIRSFCHIEGARLGPGAVAGPYARLRPGALLEEAAHVGNFVEMKKARLGKGAKASHLTYLGDAEIGAGANIGAGTITCNYDGKNKHTTRIGEGAFIGSNTALVAPVSVGDGALVGAGSVITKNVPEGRLGLSRAPQHDLPIREKK